ncbi:Glycoside hydrolase, family 43 [Metarhizium album ARSEF 1941]|uniref:Glycoside hydrolase, family 43 n=1 Tax=Metarhizium album (strain ARSEF 1941) TaxID=1081103 RepID=A0A0B2X7V2_METAS|nr:Glycoside hydrolase, family 43 [Metarhizium album ARSEF 1941]KHO01366.1 Glycoside hydrolase, family 43 [Metarhizium album ARSEF 1941]
MKPSLFLAVVPAVAAHTPDFKTSEAGNPFVDGLYADPDNEFYNNQYWVYATSSYEYDKQTYLDAFSSPDLVHWTKHSNVLVAADFKWARRAIWAPAPIWRNGKYYLYFGANDIQTNSELGGIGVGISDQPQGPYKDALGKPLIGQYYNGAQPIDQDVFIDDDGQAYIYYGGHGHANVAKLNRDMVTMGTLDDGTSYKEITPENYVEGPQMMKRNGTYYLFWSEGGWGGPDYAVSYGMSKSPTGPFKRLAKILEQDTSVASGSGHNGVIHVPNTDIYYIVYHRHPLGENVDANDRHLAYDRLYFNADGTIRPVRMLVHDNFNDGNMIGWTTYGGSWNTKKNALNAGNSAGGKALLNTNFGDVDFSADIEIPSGNGGDAGLVFRASNLALETDAYDGYYAGISTSGKLVLGKAQSGSWTQLASVTADIVPGKTYRVRVAAKKNAISVFAGDSTTAQLHVLDGTFARGMNGVRVFQTDAVFDNVKVEHLS